MKYSVTTKQAMMSADEFISRYRDVERIRSYCLQCPGFGKSWSCPPFDFDPRAASDGYNTVKIMGATIEFDESVRDSCITAEQSSAMGKQAIDEVCQSLLPRIYEMERETPGSRCFTFRCTLCPEGCTRPEGKPCRKPELMRHSLESVGFDLVAVTRDLLGIDLEWSTDGRLPKHITIVTALFSHSTVRDDTA